MNDNNKNLALARFITSFGSMNNYKSSVLQTKRVLDNEVGAKLPKNDTAIFYVKSSTIGCLTLFFSCIFDK